MLKIVNVLKKLSKEIELVLKTPMSLSFRINEELLNLLHNMVIIVFCLGILIF